MKLLLILVVAVAVVAAKKKIKAKIVKEHGRGKANEADFEKRSERFEKQAVVENDIIDERPNVKRLGKREEEAERPPYAVSYCSVVCRLYEESKCKIECPNVSTENKFAVCKCGGDAYPSAKCYCE